MLFQLSIKLYHQSKLIGIGRQNFCVNQEFVVIKIHLILLYRSKYPSTLQHMAIDVLSAITKETPENEKSHDRLGHLGLLQPLSDVANTRRIYNQ